MRPSRRRHLEIKRAIPCVPRLCREGRAEGFTFTTMDCVIAAVDLEHAASVFTLDKDSTRIATLRGLVLYPLPRTN